jgi:hypothetical protein
MDDLARAVADLASRVDAIEQQLGLRNLSFPVSDASPPERPVLSRAREGAPGSSLTPILGRALLGLAGAYLLRALDVGVGAGFLYASVWLVWAARTSAERRLETAMYSLTSVVVLAPLLWEATLKFHAITTWQAGAVLVVFTVFGLSVSWRKNLLIVATIATLAGLGTAGALLMATHDVLPFTVVFLAIGAAVEISACLNHWLSERWLAATAADLAVLLATWLVANPRGLPESYAPIPHAGLVATQAALLAIYLSSTIVRTLFRHLTMTWFETAQCVAAFAVIASGGLGPSIGVLALVCGAACYAVALLRLDHRNFYTYSTFGIVLGLFGTWVLFPAAAAAVWGALAIACAAAGSIFGHLTLEVHGGAYLLLSAILSGAIQEGAAQLLGNATWPGQRPLAVTACAAGAVVCYALSKRARLPAAALGAWFGAVIGGGLLTAGYHAALGADATHAYCATLRTGVLVALALAMAWAGARWQRLELSRLIYPAMTLGAYRLVMEDLHLERKAALFLSLLLYGGALMLLPRLRQSEHKPVSPQGV